MLQPYLQYQLDPGRALTVGKMTSSPYAEGFQPITTPTPDFGYTKSSIWLRLDVQNVTDNISHWRLFFRENFMQQFDVYAVTTEGGVKTLVHQDEMSTFDSRPIAFPELVSPLELNPGEKATLFVRYESGGSSEISFSIETVNSFETSTSRRTAKNFIYYGMVVLLCVIATLAWAVTRQTPFIAYTFYTMSALMFIMHADGNAFKYIWPQSPMFNAFATILLGTCLSVTCTNFARIFLRTRIFHPWIDKALVGMIILSLTIFASSLFFDHQQIKRVLILTTLISIILATGAGFVAALTRFKEVRFYVLAWTGVLISAGIMTGRHWLGIEISEEVQFDSMRIVLVIDATMMGLAIWDSLNQGRKAQHLALKSSLQNAERALKLSTRLHDLEQKYEAAINLSRARDKKMVNTLHDLRQPLHALRLNVNTLVQSDRGTVDPSAMEQTFDYLENLVTEHFADSTGEDFRIADEPDDMSGEADNRTQLHFDDILKSIHEMFLPDAREKKLDFHFVPSSKETSADALVMMRMISNLVSNSIKYTDKGRILLGVRKVGETMRIEVHDTGGGMTREQFKEAKQRRSRLDKHLIAKPGSGYGLAIVEELARRHGYEFDMLCERPSGLSLGITVPISDVKQEDRPTPRGKAGLSRV